MSLQSTSGLEQHFISRAEVRDVRVGLNMEAFYVSYESTPVVKVFATGSTRPEGDTKRVHLSDNLALNVGQGLALLDIN